MMKLPAKSEAELVPVKLKRFSALAASKHRCLSCSFTQTYCLCDTLKALRGSPPLQSTTSETSSNADCQRRLAFETVEIYIYINLREKFKASNTGKLIYAICNDASCAPLADALSGGNAKQMQQRLWGADVHRCVSRYVICDHPEDEAQLCFTLEKGRDSSRCLQLLLFPSSDALTVRDLLTQQAKQCDAEHPTEHAYRPRFDVLRLVILDGTWRQARRMNRKIPPWVPRCRLSSLTVSEFYIRNQSQLGRISTVEAVVLFFGELAQCCSVESSPKAFAERSPSFFSVSAQLMRDGLRALTYNVVKQSHKEVYLEELEQRNAKGTLRSRPVSGGRRHQLFCAMEAVRLHLAALLTTPDRAVRERANHWLSEVFQKGQDAWAASIALISQASEDATSVVSAQDLQLFGAQTLYLKLENDLGQIFDDQQQCVELCRFLVEFSLVPSERLLSLTAPVRFKLASCLAVAAVSFLGGPWPSALEDIISAGVRRPDGTEQKAPLSRIECVVRTNLMRLLGEIPELVLSLERKRYLMQCLGHITYTNWKKTEAGKAVLAHYPTVSRLVGETLRLALDSLKCETTEAVACITIHEAFVVATHWSQTFDVPFLLASNELSDPTLLRVLLSTAQLLHDEAVAEMFAANVSRLTIPRQEIPSPGSSFELTQLGAARCIIEPLLVFLADKLLAPFVAMAGGFHVPTLKQLEANGGEAFLSFAYHWAPVIYSLAVVAPSLLVSQNSAAPCSTGKEILPEKLVVQLLKAESLIHPMVHARILEMWTDVVDMHSDGQLKKHDVALLLQELVEVTLRCSLTHSRRDSPIWHNPNGFCDAEGRGSYIDNCQDCIVSLYFLYQGIDGSQAITLVRHLLSAFTQACDPASLDAPLAASCLLLMDSIIEAVIDFTSGEFVSALTTICEKVILDKECVCIVANLIKKQAVFLTDPEHADLWRTFFQCLMRMLDVEPRQCARGIYELCESGGNLGLQQVQRPTDLILNFYSYIEEKTAYLRDQRAEFESLLWGALAALIRRLPPSEAPAIFAESLAATTQHLGQLHKEAVHDGSRISELILSLRRLSYAMWSLETDVSQGPTAQELRQACICRLFFDMTGDFTMWQNICSAVTFLLEQPCRDPATGLLIPASDCYTSRKFDENIAIPTITALSAHNVAIHIVRQVIRAAPVDQYSEFWDSIGRFVVHRLKGKPPSEFDASVFLCLRDVLQRLLAFDMEHGHVNVEGSAEAYEAQRLLRLPAASMIGILDEHIMPSVVCATTAIPVQHWGSTMKPFFLFMESLAIFETTTGHWRLVAMRELMPVLVKALQCPSSKLQQSNLECLKKFLSTKNQQIAQIMMESYYELVRSFWCFCHFWDFQRITRAVNLMEHLVRPSFLNNSADEFVRLSCNIFTQVSRPSQPLPPQRESVGLIGVLSEADLRMALNLLEHVRGFRLRQLLMDLIKIGKGAATPDCLLSYQFVLDDVARRHSNAMMAPQHTAVVDLD